MNFNKNIKNNQVLTERFEVKKFKILLTNTNNSSNSNNSK
jgi:hypothetical protein